MLCEGALLNITYPFSSWRQFHLRPDQMSCLSAGYLHPYGFLAGEGRASAYVGDFTDRTSPDFFAISDLGEFSLSGLIRFRVGGSERIRPFSKTEQFLARLHRTPIICGRFAAPDIGLQTYDLAIDEQTYLRLVVVTNRTAEKLSNVRLNLYFDNVERLTKSNENVLIGHGNSSELSIISTAPLEISGLASVDILGSDLDPFSSHEFSLYLSPNSDVENTKTILAIDPPKALHQTINCWHHRQPRLVSSDERYRDFFDEIQIVTHQMLTRLEPVSNEKKNKLDPLILPFADYEASEISTFKEKIPNLFPTFTTDPVSSLGGMEDPEKIWRRLNRRPRSMGEFNRVLARLSESNHPLATRMGDDVFRSGSKLFLPWEHEADLLALGLLVIRHYSGIVATPRTVSFFPGSTPCRALEINFSERNYRLRKRYYRGSLQTELVDSDQPVLSINRDCFLSVSPGQIRLKCPVFSEQHAARINTLRIEFSDDHTLEWDDAWRDGEITYHHLRIRWRMHGKLRKINIKNLADHPTSIRIEGAAYSLSKNGLLHLKLDRKYTQPLLETRIRRVDGTLLEEIDPDIDREIHIEGVALDPYGFPLHHLRLHYGSENHLLNLDQTGYFSQILTLHENVSTLKITGRRGCGVEFDLTYQLDFWARVHSFVERNQQTCCVILGESKHYRPAVLLQERIQKITHVYLPIDPGETSSEQYANRILLSVSSTENRSAEYYRINTHNNGDFEVLLGTTGESFQNHPFLRDLAAYF